jgi:hypothetical protein
MKQIKKYTIRIVHISFLFIYLRYNYKYIRLLEIIAASELFNADSQREILFQLGFERV